MLVGIGLVVNNQKQLVVVKSLLTCNFDFFFLWLEEIHGFVGLLSAQHVKGKNLPKESWLRRKDGLNV